MFTLDGEIGDLKRKSCQLVVQNTGQVRSSKTPMDPGLLQGTRKFSRQKLTHAYDAFDLRREGHL